MCFKANFSSSDSAWSVILFYYRHPSEHDDECVWKYHLLNYKTVERQNSQRGCDGEEIVNAIDITVNFILKNSLCLKKQSTRWMPRWLRIDCKPNSIYDNIFLALFNHNSYNIFSERIISHLSPCCLQAWSVKNIIPFWFGSFLWHPLNFSQLLDSYYDATVFWKVS